MEFKPGIARLFFARLVVSQWLVPSMGAVREGRILETHDNFKPRHLFLF